MPLDGPHDPELISRPYDIEKNEGGEEQGLCPGRRLLLLTQRLGSAAEEREGSIRDTMSKLSADTLREGIAGRIPCQADAIAVGQTCQHAVCQLAFMVPSKNRHCAGIFEGAKAKPRKFTETVELQVVPHELY